MGMTINDAIDRYSNNAEYERTHGNLQGCLEFKQLVDWLKDYKRLKEQESKTDAHGTCKDCKYNVKDGKTTAMCDIGHRFYMREPSTFYCADFEMKGSEDGRHRISY